MILAIDPTLSSFGYSLYDDNLSIIDVGVFTTEKSKHKQTRVSDDDSFRAQQLVKMIAEYVLKHKVKGIMGERPSGSQTASALKSFCTANTIVDCISALMNIPVEWCTPAETKKGIVGKATASKTDIMLAVCKLYKWKIETKEIKTLKGIRIDNVYYPLGIKMSAGKFEHIADSISAFEYLKHASQIIKLYLNKALVA